MVTRDQPFFDGESMRTLLIKAQNDEVLKGIWEAANEKAKRDEERAKFAFKILDEIKAENKKEREYIWPKIEARLMELGLIENDQVSLSLDAMNGEITRDDSKKGGTGIGGLLAEILGQLN